MASASSRVWKKDSNIPTMAATSSVTWDRIPLEWDYLGTPQVTNSSVDRSPSRFNTFSRLCALNFSKKNLATVQMWEA